MPEFARHVQPVNIVHELKHSFVSYAMTVIARRALPDVRDGLKPVHRRVLYAMYVLKNDWNKPYKKSARIVGDVIGKYHPHGEAAAYDAYVRMAQLFSLRYTLIDGQGNYGSVDGDKAAASRYTEGRLKLLAHEMLNDLDQDTVDFVPNYDGNEKLPDLLPAAFPNLLVNGASGIAVGMATNIPPHNLGEVIHACLALIDDPDMGIDELMTHVLGPDFPTAGIINGRTGIVQAYRTGKGRIHMRAKTRIEEEQGRESIIVTELPYQINKALLVEKIAILVKSKQLTGISAIRDESDKDGMRIVIEVRRSDNAEVVLNNLYQQTSMQTIFAINMVALDRSRPKLLNLKALLSAFLDFRREVVTRRSLYQLKQARARAHILEGLSVALSNMDEIILLIRAAKTPQEAKQQLLEGSWKVSDFLAALLTNNQQAASYLGDANGFAWQKGQPYRLTDVQAQAILDLKLHRLTGLEQNKIVEEYHAIMEKIKDLLAILQNSERLLDVIREELTRIKAQFGDSRRTEILSDHLDLTNEDLIPQEDKVVTLSELGYVKTQSLDSYQAQHRGGRGKGATTVKEDDFVKYLAVANSHDTLLCFSNHGKVYWLKTYQIPAAQRSARGRPIVNLLPLASGELIHAILPVSEFSDDRFVCLATSRGTIKRVQLSAFSNPRKGGIIALDLVEGDHLIGAEITDGQADMMLFSNSGKVVRFPESQVRVMGRTARGVRGMKLLQEQQKVIALIVARSEQGAILTATENGYGKRTNLQEFRCTSRGTQGVIAIQVTERNGCVVGAAQVQSEDEMLLISDGGTLVRIPIEEVSLVGRNTQGVRLIHLVNGEKLIALQSVITSIPDGC